MNSQFHLVILSNKIIKTCSCFNNFVAKLYNQLNCTKFYKFLICTSGKYRLHSKFFSYCELLRLSVPLGQVVIAWFFTRVKAKDKVLRERREPSPQPSLQISDARTTGIQEDSWFPCQIRRASIKHMYCQNAMWVVISKEREYGSWYILWMRYAT